LELPSGTFVYIAPLQLGDSPLNRYLVLPGQPETHSTTPSYLNKGLAQATPEKSGQWGTPSTEGWSSSWL